MYDSDMNQYSWSQEKNLILQDKRGITFEEIVAAIEADHLLGHVDHSTKLQQKIYIVEINGYPWDVPYVVQEDGSIFLKTAFPNRKRK